jgi:hypothetical protein
MLGPYVFSMLVMVFPNILLMSAAFFTLTGMTRSMLATYLGVVISFVIYMISSFFMADLESEWIASLLDPYGIATLQEATKYWTIVEKNGALPELGGMLLYNRLLWIAVALAILAFGVWRFSYSRATSPRRLRALRRDDRSQQPAEEPAPACITPAAARPVAAQRSFTPGDAWRMLLLQSRLETAGVLKSVPFIIMLAFGMFNLIVSITMTEQILGTSVHPVTYLMLQSLQGSFLFLLIIILTFYSGELIWKERSLKLDEVYNALPAPSWVFLFSKLFALLMVVLAFSTVGVLCTAGFQIAHGYTRLEPVLYVKGLLMTVVPFAMIGVLAAAVQVLSKSKLLGYLVMIGYLISFDVLDALDLQHNLYRFAGSPNVSYSAMNGYGHLVTPTLWFWAYWACCCLALIGLCMIFWVRGSETSWKIRWQLARQRFHGAARFAVVGGLVGFIATGAFIFYNTNLLNDYVPSDKLETMQADYEKQYRQYKDLPQPRITDTYAEVDIYPAERRVEIRGRYLLLNRDDVPISELHLNLSPEVTVNRLELPPYQVAMTDERLGYHIYQLDEPLAPHATMEMSFDITVAHHGFVNHGSDTSIVYNGTFFDNRDYFPLLGYNEGMQLVDRNARRKHDLEPVLRMAKVDDLEARRNTYVVTDSDWIGFETVVSTSADQVAIAPGYLQRQWQEGERRYFHYKMDATILNFFAYLSADYQVRHDTWNDVAIDIYYHQPHDYNLDRMIEGVKKTLAYCEANFSPYQHRQVRILEFPRYATFAQSFPNTIPYSDGCGFIARVDDEEDIDYIFYVTAHEVAHQWWAHQVIGGNVQGCTLMSEALAQYTALMVMEQEYGKEKMHRFLKFELDRYLRGRGNELVEELPLLLVENQGYIHYRKGSVVMYALRDYLGEERLNTALASYVDRVAFQQAPFTNSLEFLATMRETFGDEADDLFADMLENITLYSNRVEDAVGEELQDGRYQVTLSVTTRKLRADGRGIETEIPIDDWIDVGVFGEDESDVLYLEKHHVTEPEMTFTVVVDQAPARAGIDPYNKLIDRDSDDNVSSVKVG